MIELLNIHPQCVTGALWLFLALAIGHAVADFPLQGVFLSETKNRNHKLSQDLNTKSPQGVWNCGAVWLITGSVVLGLAEFFLHWIIDFAKCENWAGFNTDQFLHYGCKIIYVALIYYGVVSI
ncbi:MAG: DUF3307 domain-containing protein [Verrucomicrobiaceae bacterium]|nr:DUF3307 domain-containing protein [Verrucomicrobiaceae bacterium]